MKTFNFEANGLDFGEWIAETKEQAQDNFAQDAGYKNWAYMCECVEEFGGNTITVTEGVTA